MGGLAGYAGYRKKHIKKILGTTCQQRFTTTLESWHEEAINSVWASPQAVKDQYGNASVCGSNRIVFNIAGNKYRLIIEFQYQGGIAWVKFIGTHAQYDKINVETVNDY